MEFPSKEDLETMFADEELPFDKETLSNLGNFSVVDFLEMLFESLQIVIDELPIYEYQPLEDLLPDNSYYSVEPEILKQLSIPRIMWTKDEKDFPLLVIRIFTSDGGLLTEALCSPFRVIGNFAGSAISVIDGYKKAGGFISDEDLRIFIVRKTANMLISALSKIGARIELTINSFMQEVAFDWMQLWYETSAEDNSLLGGQTQKFAFNNNTFAKSYLKIRNEKMK